jgi:hypothetical protein
MVGPSIDCTYSKTKSSFYAVLFSDILMKFMQFKIIGWLVIWTGSQSACWDYYLFQGKI